MKTNYTITDLFRLRKLIKVMATIDNNDGDLLVERIDYAYKNPSPSKFASLFFNHFKDITEQKLPRLCRNRINVMVADYHKKVNERGIKNIGLTKLKLQNRLMPLGYSAYNVISKRSPAHFKIVTDIFERHYHGKGAVNAK